jgi:hypothetical protein
VIIIAKRMILAALCKVSFPTAEYEMLRFSSILIVTESSGVSIGVNDLFLENYFLFLQFFL